MVSRIEQILGLTWFYMSTQISPGTTPKGSQQLDMFSNFKLARFPGGQETDHSGSVYQRGVVSRSLYCCARGDMDKDIF